MADKENWGMNCLLTYAKHLTKFNSFLLFGEM